jgi:hypothetical protein
MYDDLKKKQASDNPTIGILLCTEATALLPNIQFWIKTNNFCSKYLPHLPTEEELIAEIEREK